MKFSSRKSIAGFALALTAGLASADTVTFDGLRSSAGDNLGNAVSSEGFTFFSSADLFATPLNRSADPVGETLEYLETEAPLLVVKDDLSAFNLVSLDLASVPGRAGDDGGDDDGHHHHHHRGSHDHYVGSSGDVTLIYLEPGTDDTFLTMTLHLDEKPGLQTFQIGLDDITLFALVDVPFQLDNVVTTGVVPEPGTMATILAGLATLVTLARRRRT